MNIWKTYLPIVFSVAAFSFSTAQAKPPQESVNTLGQLQCVAGEVALYDGLNWVCADITAALEGAVSELTARVSALEAENQELITRLACVKSTSDANNFMFEGCNVHVRNGEAATDTINGYGNLIVGYDEERDDGESCSLGRYWDNQTDCENAGGVWWLNDKTGSHNLVIGPEHNYSSYGGLVAGERNTISGESASVTAGYINTASLVGASVSGGIRNTASGNYASVSAGELNIASGAFSSVNAGQDNVASGGYSSVSGGSANTAAGPHSSVSGGNHNIAAEFYSTVSGGAGCIAAILNSWGVGDTYLTSIGCVYNNLP